MASFRLEDLKVVDKPVKIFREYRIPSTKDVSSDRTNYIQGCNDQCDCDGQYSVCNCEDIEDSPIPPAPCPCDIQRGF